MLVIRTHPKPDCGAQMRLKRPKPGSTWAAFWGCSQFRYGDKASCKGTPEDDSAAFEPGDFDD